MRVESVTRDSARHLGIVTARGDQLPVRRVRQHAHVERVALVAAGRVNNEGIGIGTEQTHTFTYALSRPAPSLSPSPSPPPVARHTPVLSPLPQPY